MPLPLALIGAGITAGAGIAGAGMANRSNRKLADQQAQWNIDQWNRQTAYDTDMWNRNNQWQLDMWNRVNHYNSPAEQMARFTEAGLNPHLIYTKGNAGNAGQIASSPVKSPDVKPYSRHQSQNVLRGFDAFSQYANFRNLQAQTDNLRAQNEILEVEAFIKKQQSAENILNMEKKHYDNKLQQELYDTQVQTAQEALEKLKQDRATSKSLEALNYSKEQLNIAEKALAQYGLSKNDPAIVRFLASDKVQGFIKNFEWEKFGKALNILLFDGNDIQLIFTNKVT